MIHRPEMLILDEPTSGVDPVARDMFWQLMVDLSRQDKVTIFISTHFMNEAERCDRMSLMHAGKVLASGTPQELVKQRGAASLEEAFISWLQEAAGRHRKRRFRKRLLRWCMKTVSRRGRALACGACSATAAVKRWSCGGTRCVQRWR